MLRRAAAVLPVCAVLSLGACATAAPDARLATTLSHARPDVCMSEAANGNRTYKLTALPVSQSAMGFVAEAQTVGKRPATVVSMSFVVRSPNWRYDKCSTLALGGAEGLVVSIGASRKRRIELCNVPESRCVRLEIVRLD